MLSTRSKAMEGDHVRADWHCRLLAALERDSATTAGSSQLDALIALERIGTRRSYFRNDKIYAEGDAADCWYKAAFGTVRVCKLRTRNPGSTTTAISAAGEPRSAATPT
ncbi:MAG TPA: hypothetical protein VKG22_00200 [Stellaceae bacterium]|nr:hypothetical protein [Stellaceae bacterium]HMD65054.1 hypothetical protein [Stellaceae bacterium]